MPLIRQLLIALRTLTEDEPQPYSTRSKRKKNNNGGKRNRQASALVITFRDLFRSGDLNVILEEMEFNRRCYRRNTHNSSCTSSKTCYSTSASCFDTTNQQSVNDKALVVSDHNVSLAPLVRSDFQDETLPLLHEEITSVPCTDLVASSPLPGRSSGLFGGLSALSRNNKKHKNLTVPLSTDDENKTVETLRKVLKWSPRKQNSATFAVPLPKDDEQKALAVVQNAVNRVKEEQQHKKKQKFFWLKFC